MPGLGCPLQAVRMKREGSRSGAALGTGQAALDLPGSSTNCFPVPAGSSSLSAP